MNQSSIITSFAAVLSVLDVVLFSYNISSCCSDVSFAYCCTISCIIAIAVVVMSALHVIALFFVVAVI